MTSQRQHVEPDERRDFTKRTCRGCGKHYLWPIHSRRPGALCPECQPALPFTTTPDGRV